MKRLAPADLRPYTRDELAGADPGFPERGAVCVRCRTHVPQFSDLSPDDEARVRELIRRDEPMLAMSELEAASGCPPRWAKIWVNHKGSLHPGFDGPPCPICGEPLVSSKSQQCLHCGADWHA
jgi:hypothetical protein